MKRKPNRENQKEVFNKAPCISLFFPLPGHRLLVILLPLLLLIYGTQVIAAEKLCFKQALPGWEYEFPRDHRAHREFKTEWWYYNGYLRGPEEKNFGFQVTFFRVGLLPRSLPKESSQWRIRDVIMAHLAVTDINRKAFLYQEKAGRANLGLAGADLDQYRVWVENWQVLEEGKGHRIQAGGGDLSLSLKIIPTGPPLVHGVNGFVRKGTGSDGPPIIIR